jgi:hypothetical protein
MPVEASTEAEQDNVAEVLTEREMPALTTVTLCADNVPVPVTGANTAAPVSAATDAVKFAAVPAELDRPLPDNRAMPAASALEVCFDSDRPMPVDVCDCAVSVARVCADCDVPKPAEVLFGATSTAVPVDDAMPVEMIAATPVVRTPVPVRGTNTTSPIALNVLAFAVNVARVCTDCEVPSPAAVRFGATRAAVPVENVKPLDESAATLVIRTPVPKAGGVMTVPEPAIMASVPATVTGAPAVGMYAVGALARSCCAPHK